MLSSYAVLFAKTNVLLTIKSTEKKDKKCSYFNKRNFFTFLRGTFFTFHEKKKKYAW